RPTFMQLNQPVKADPASIPLLRTDGTEVTLGQVATGKVVVVVPWISLQENAPQRIRDVRDAVRGLQGVQIIAVNSQRSPKEAFLRDLAKQEQSLEVPVYVDAQVKLLPFINEHLRMRAKDRKILTVPPYAVFTNSLRNIAIDIPSADLKVDAERVVNQALVMPPAPTQAPTAASQGDESADGVPPGRTGSANPEAATPSPPAE